MYLGGVIPDARTPYDGLAYEIYLSGCSRKCKGCHNPEMWDFEYGKPLDVQALIDDIKHHDDWIDIISFLGGDPLLQDKEEFMRLVIAIKANFPDKKLWLFTGEDIWEKIPFWIRVVFDVIKYGRYNEKLKQEGFPASSNQKVVRKEGYEWIQETK